MPVLLYISAQSYHPLLLKKFDQKVRRALGGSYTIKNSFFFPVKTKKVTVLRSPHIDKKSREQFELRQYKSLYSIKLSNSYSAKTTCTLLKKNAFSGLGLSLKKTEYVIL